MILVVFLIYLFVLLAVGLACTRLNRNLSDYILGGRRLGTWLTAISAQASDMSGWLFIGLPAAAYLAGFSILWVIVGLLVGIVFSWLVMAIPMRQMTEASGSLTIPDFLESRVGRGKFPAVRIVSVLIILIFYASYIAAQYIAAGKIFETIFSNVQTPWGTVSLTYHQGVLIGSIVILAYTMAGGFLAAAYTDFIQGMMMAVALIILPTIAILNLGGFGELFQAMQAANPTSLTITGGKEGMALLTGVVIGSLSWGLGYPGQPHILVNFMAIRETQKLRMSALIAIVWAILVMYGAAALGFVGLAQYGPGMTDPDQIFPLLSVANLPPWFSGVLMSAAVAAMMSTVDSQLLVAISALVEDIYVKLFGGNPEGKTALVLSRAICLALGVAAILISWRRTDVFGQVFNAWGGLASGLGPAVLMALFWKRVTSLGLVAGMVFGTVAIHIWGDSLTVIFFAGLFLIWLFGQIFPRKI
ncbi:MAG: sodium/proline symporter [Deltaproteobacteria bacterium]|nr:sodium/proline symporter [Deltaproteobacteria bacterium]